MDSKTEKLIRILIISAKTEVENGADRETLAGYIEQLNDAVNGAGKSGQSNDSCDCNGVPLFGSACIYAITGGKKCAAPVEYDCIYRIRIGEGNDSE